jgi:hypothetical protein
MAFDAKAMQLRLRGIGINAGVGHELVSLFQKWITDSGEEWAVDRLKLMKLDLLHHYAGLPPVPRKKGDSWYKVKSGIPVGPYSVLFKMSKHHFRKAWNAILIYTGVVFDHPELKVSERQWRKAIQAIERPDLSATALVYGLQMTLQSPISQKRIRVSSDTGSPLVDYQTSDSRRSPLGYKTVKEPEGLLKSLRVLLEYPQWTARNWDILSGTLKGIEDLVLPELELNLIDDDKAGTSFQESLAELPEVGSLALIQEAGLKLRSAANPHRFYQAALKPLGDALFAVLRTIPQDYTFDQLAGIQDLQDVLSRGHRVWCTDLSNATDNVPLEFQLQLMSKMGVSSRWLQFFKSCCRGSWVYSKYKKRMKYGRTRWTVGQPLGLYPSFASFALWHHALVQSLYRELDPGAEMLYGICGDDFWCASEKVLLGYTSFMEMIGAPIQEQKVLAAPATAEFLGRIITPSEIHQGFKAKGRCSDDSWVDMLRNLGPNAIVLLRKRQRRILSFIADLPEPYGLGWNPLGIPLEERWTPELERAFNKDVRLRSFSRRGARIQRIFGDSGLLGYEHIQGYRELDAAFLSSDQDESRLVAKVLPGWESWGWLMLPNILEIARVNDFSPELEAEIGLSLQRTSSLETRKQATTLVMLERKVQSVLSR